jgi:transposase
MCFFAKRSAAPSCCRFLQRSRVARFFCQVFLEACGGAHHWARELLKLGHGVRLIAPAFVNLFVTRQKNDAADAEAICEAAQRLSMRFVPVKTEEQQAPAMEFRGRDLLVRQRTQSGIVDRLWCRLAHVRGLQAQGERYQQQAHVVAH